MLKRRSNRKSTPLVLAGSLLIIACPLFAYVLNFNYYGAKLVKRNNDREIYKKSDGTTIFKFKHKETAILRDKTKIVRYNDGRREIFAPDGVIIFFDYDGTVEYRYPDGTIKKISMDGRTPYGLEIKELKKTVRRGSFYAEIIYSPQYSDDNINRYIKKFFDEIERQIHIRVYRNRIENKKMKLVFSNCRFCKTGYCRRKNVKGLEIIVFVNNRKREEIKINYSDLLKKSDYIKIAAKTVENILAIK